MKCNAHNKCFIRVIAAYFVQKTWVMEEGLSQMWKIVQNDRLVNKTNRGEKRRVGGDFYSFYSNNNIIMMINDHLYLISTFKERIQLKVQLKWQNNYKEKYKCSKIMI